MVSSVFLLDHPGPYGAQLAAYHHTVAWARLNAELPGYFMSLVSAITLALVLPTVRYSPEDRRQAQAEFIILCQQHGTDASPSVFRSPIAELDPRRMFCGAVTWTDGTRVGWL